MPWKEIWDSYKGRILGIAGGIFRYYLFDGWFLGYVVLCTRGVYRIYAWQKKRSEV